jgi:catechol 2,3-dioxygenase-like lactoylglutathione lyase family enzyme
MTTLRAVTTMLIGALAASAQLASPNAQGVAMGHLHLNSAETDVQKKFWTEIIGAQLYEKNGLSGVTVPGALILIHQAAPKGATVGSSVDHIGFTVPDLKPFYAKLDAAGLKHFKPGAAEQIMIEGPEGVRVELSEDKAATLPLRFHHIHFHNTDPKAMQAWYAKTFGALPGKRAQWEAGDIPGANLTFAHADAAAPTQGRALDHIGFEVKDLEAFCKNLTAAGVKLEIPFRVMPQLKLSLAFLIDPWGTRIELTEGLRTGL